MHLETVRLTLHRVREHDSRSTHGLKRIGKVRERDSGSTHGEKQIEKGQDQVWADDMSTNIEGAGGQRCLKIAAQGTLKLRCRRREGC